MIDLESNSEFSVAQFRSHKVGQGLNKPIDVEAIDSQCLDYCKALYVPEMSDYVNNIVYYIAGFVVKKLLKSLRCSECAALLCVLNNPISDHTYCKTHISNPASFTHHISRGGLKLASEAVFRIVKYSEKCFRSLVRFTDFSKPNMYAHFVYSVCHYFTLNHPKVFPFTHTINSAIDMEDLHETKLIKDIVSTYVSVRLRAHSRAVTIHATKGSIRQKLTKVILFSNV